MLLAICILGALYRAQGHRPGRSPAGGDAGCDAALHPHRLCRAVSHRQGGGGAPARSSVSDATPPCGIYPCKGGGSNDYVYVFTSRANPDHWRRLLKVIGREELIGDARYETPAARAETRTQVNAMIADWTKQHTKHEAMEIIGAAGVPAGAVLDTMELHNDQSFEQRGILQTIEHPTAGPSSMPAWPVRFEGRPPPRRALAAARPAQRAGAQRLARTGTRMRSAA